MHETGCSGLVHRDDHMLTWISHGFTCIPHPEPPLSSLPIPSVSDRQSRLDAWDKCSGLVHRDDPEGKFHFQLNFSSKTPWSNFMFPVKEDGSRASLVLVVSNALSSAGDVGLIPDVWGSYMHGAIKPAHVLVLSWVRLLGTPQTTAHQAFLSMGFSREEY